MPSVEGWLCSPSCSYLKRWREILFDTPLGLREQGSREALHSLHCNASVELIIAVSSPENPFRGVCVMSGWWCKPLHHWGTSSVLKWDLTLTGNQIFIVCVFHGEPKIVAAFWSSLGESLRSSNFKTSSDWGGAVRGRRAEGQGVGGLWRMPWRSSGKARMTASMWALSLATVPWRTGSCSFSAWFCSTKCWFYRFKLSVTRLFFVFFHFDFFSLMNIFSHSENLVSINKNNSQNNNNNNTTTNNNFQWTKCNSFKTQTAYVAVVGSCSSST